MPNETKVTLPVRCRPDQSLWIIVVLLAPIGVAMLSMPLWAPQPKQSDVVVMWVLGGMIAALFLVMPGVLAWWLLRGEIVADGETLCWRNFGRRRCARWEQVRDFYDCPTDNARNKRAHIETEVGRFVLLGKTWKNSAELRKAIEERATKAAVHHWAFKGAREEDPWPRQFDYATIDNKSTGWILVLCPLALVGVSALNGYEKGRQGTNINWAVDWPLAAASIGVYMVMLAAIASPAYLLWAATRQRRDQKIIATRSELQQHEGNITRVLQWSEITSYYSLHEGFLRFAPRFVVEGRREQISFIPTIKERAVLQEIIRQYALNADVSEWAAREDDEVLVSPATRWSGGALGVGNRIYPYHTRTNRALLWLPTAIFVIFTFVPILTANRSILDNIIPSVLAGAAASWGWWRFYRAAVEVGETFITHRGAFGERTMDWSAVRKYSLVGGDVMQFIELKSDTQRLLFWYGVADLEELKIEITSRAVNSTTREWNEL